MGIYDREYYQDEQGGSFLGRGAARSAGHLSVTVRLIIVNTAIYVVTIFLSPEAQNRLVWWLGHTNETLSHPWMWWQMFTYGFVHDPSDVMHLIFNMASLYFIGRVLEERLGSAEFLRFYIASLVFGGFVGSLHFALSGGDAPHVGIGASGAVSAVVLLTAFYYPRLQVLLMMVIPTPFWLVAAIIIGYNVLGSLGRAAGKDVGNIGYEVHLAGIAFAAAYYYFHWNLGRPWQRIARLWPGSGTGGRSKPRVLRLRVLRGEDEEKLAAEADRILAKLHAEGAGSLTAKERKILENYSRKMRNKKDR